MLSGLAVLIIFKKLTDHQIWRCCQKTKKVFPLSNTYEFYELSKERLFILQIICAPTTITPSCVHPGQVKAGSNGR